MKPLHIIGVPLDLGGNRRGVDMGPSAFRIAGLGEKLAALGYPILDKGDLTTPIPETQKQRDERKKYINDIAKVCQRLYQASLASFDEGAMPIVLGGDHSLGAGSVAAAAEWARKAQNLPIGLIWVDAHGDMLAPKFGPIQPYGLAGIGLIRTSFEGGGDDQNQAGYDLGGGLMAFFSSHVGIRGDVRYFHAFEVLDLSRFPSLNLNQETKLDFGRFSVAVVFKF